MAFYEVIKTFRVRQDGNSIELSEGQIVSIPGEKAGQLLSTGKIKPCVGDESIRSSPEPDDERFSNAFDRAVGRMSGEYKAGFFNRARLQRPGKFSRFMVCEDRVNQFWDAGDFESFERALEEWWDFYGSLLASFGT